MNKSLMRVVFVSLLFCFLYGQKVYAMEAGAYTSRFLRVTKDVVGQSGDLVVGSALVVGGWGGYKIIKKMERKYKKPLNPDLKGAIIFTCAVLSGAAAEVTVESLCPESERVQVGLKRGLGFVLAVLCLLDYEYSS